MIIRCAYCQNQINLQAAVPGMQVICPFCRNSFVLNQPPKKNSMKIVIAIAAAAFIALLVLLAGVFMYLDNNGVFRASKEERDMMASAERFEESRLKSLSDFITQNYASQKVIIVAPGGTNWEQNEYNRKRVDRLKKYLPNAEVKALNYVRNENEMAAMPGATAKEFNDFFKANGDALFVLLEDLPFEPRELGKLSIWKAKGKQKIALLSGEVSSLGFYFKGAKPGEEVIVAAVVGKTGLKEADYEKPAPENLDEAFGMRYVMITSKNIDQYIKNTAYFPQR